jgi:hypothetical protein
MEGKGGGGHEGDEAIDEFEFRVDRESYDEDSELLGPCVITTKNSKDASSKP